MKFFKHFTDAHRGRSLQSLKSRLGMDGIGRYWILVEICAEKMTKSKEEEYTEKHCRFTFDRRYLRDTLATHQISGVEKFLRCLTDVELMSYTSSDDVIEIYMPKLLESLDRDVSRARTVRAVAAPKKKRKIKREEEEVIVTTPIELVNAIGENGIRNLLEIFPQELVDYELPFMTIWLKANGPKKDYTSFAANWLKKAMNDRAESASKQKTVAKTMGIIGA